ncbi:hypothetical protein BD413DRAFT_455811, partial [Trametes elegans]
TEPATHEVQIVYGTAMPGMENVFGPIHIRKPPGRAVTVGDMLRAVYEFFQTPLRQDEADALKARYPDMWHAWGEAFRTRCREAPHIAVPTAEWNQGMRRVDTLGERVKYWGLWTTHNASNNTWQLNLGL